MGNDRSFDKQSIIQHLTKEIEVVTNNIMTYRIRAAFTVWIGPYILLGSLIIATKGSFTLVTNNWFLMWVAILTTCGCYIGLGVAAGRIEKQAWDQCDIWRDSIAKISMGSFAEASELYSALANEKLKNKIEKAYNIVFALILVSFVCVGYILSHVEKIGGDGEITANQSLKTDAAQKTRRAL